jgi:hypothetical protein
MRLPRLRFTVRWLMAGVVFVALTLAFVIEMRSRRARFQRLVNYHLQQVPMPTFCYTSCAYDLARDRWHFTLAAKYRYAARYPWFPVGRDQPPPDPDACRDSTTREQQEIEVPVNLPVLTIIHE